MGMKPGFFFGDLKRRGLTGNEWWDGAEVVGTVLYERLALTIGDTTLCLLMLPSDICLMSPPKVIPFLSTCNTT